MNDDTLIVSATYDDSHRDWYDLLPEPKVRVSTAAGGHPSKALIDTFRFGPKYHSYLLLQDTLEPVADVVAPFRDKGAPVVAWARFPLFFDTSLQKEEVERQYPYVFPSYGIFGPVFYAEHKVLSRLDRMGRFPAHPADKMAAQGTERAWAYAFALLGVPVAHLWDWSNEFLASGDALPFRKVFGARQ